LLLPLEKPLDAARHRPFIIMIAGVNGAGKTTSIGKLAKYFQAQGKSVLLAAGDTFRAAAREQLMAWGERNNVTVIRRSRAIRRPSSSTPSPLPGRAASTSCSPTPPAACRRSCT
jgi:signal recognition particle GTPase